MAAVPSELISSESILTLTGAAGSVFVICNGLQAAFNFNPRWLALALSEGIAFLGVVLANGGFTDYLLAIINGFLIFSSAAGASDMLASGVQIRQDVGTPVGATPAAKLGSLRYFASRWF